MARVLFASTMMKGYINPYIPLAQELLARGHQVGWVTLPGKVASLAALGVQPLALEGAEETPPPPIGQGAGASADAMRARVRAAVIADAPVQVAKLRKVIDAFGPDVMAFSGRLYQGVLAAHLSQVPYACLSVALRLIQPPEVATEEGPLIDSLADERKALFQRFGMEPTFRGWECLSPFLNTLFTTQAFVGEVTLPPRTQLVGPVTPRGQRGDEPAFPWERLQEARPLIYVSFGSVFNHRPELFQQICAGAREVGQVVLSAGQLMDTDFPASLPPDVIAVRYAPQLQLLERASAFITHGGANSVMEGLHHGVPLLVVPLVSDQPVQAHFVEKSGVGHALTPSTLTPTRVAEVMRALTAPQGRARREATRVQTSFRSQDGASRAVDLLLQLVR